NVGTPPRSAVASTSSASAVNGDRTPAALLAAAIRASSSARNSSTARQRYRVTTWVAIGVDGRGRDDTAGGLTHDLGRDAGDVGRDPYTRDLGQTPGVGGNEFTSAERVRGGVQSEAGQHLGTGDEP